MNIVCNNHEGTEINLVGHFCEFLPFLKTHVRIKMSISHLKLPQNLIITYQNLS